MTDRDDRFVERARAVFDAGDARIAARVRSRLNQARHAALAELDRSVPWRSVWAPAGALAVAAVVAVALWPDAQDGTGPAAVTAAPTPLVADLELLAAGEDLDLLGEDFEFYAWAEQAGLGNGVG